MKTRNWKRFCFWAVVAAVTITLAAAFKCFPLLLVSLVPVALVGVYGNKIDNENKK